MLRILIGLILIFVDVNKELIDVVSGILIIYLK